MFILEVLFMMALTMMEVVMVMMMVMVFRSTSSKVC